MHVVSHLAALRFTGHFESAGALSLPLYVVLELACDFYSCALAACESKDVSRSAGEIVDQL